MCDHINSKNTNKKITIVEQSKVENLDKGERNKSYYSAMSEHLLLLNMKSLAFAMASTMAITSHRNADLALAIYVNLQYVNSTPLLSTENITQAADPC